MEAVSLEITPIDQKKSTDQKIFNLNLIQPQFNSNSTQLKNLTFPRRWLILTLVMNNSQLLLATLTLIKKETNTINNEWDRK